MTSLTKEARITMMDFRRQPGEYIHEVYRHGKSFIVTKAGKDVALLSPISNVTVIKPDGEIIGEVPVTKGMVL